MANMSITGLDELINNCKKLSGTEIVKNTNKKILKKVGKSVQSTAKNIAPKSKDPWKSGRKGSRTGLHMADVIPLSGVKNKNNSQYILVGKNQILALITMLNLLNGEHLNKKHNLFYLMHLNNMKMN